LKNCLFTLAACCTLSLGCRGTATSVGSRVAPPPAAAPGEVLFIGMCDASAAVPLSPHTFAVADDEDNVLRVYDADRGGVALYERDISAGIGIPGKRPKKPGGQPKPPPEADIEAATRHGEIALWMTSHSRSSKGKRRPERLRFFATSLPIGGHGLRVIGRPYAGLIDDVGADPRYASFGLLDAADRAPKTPEGLNIEGMTARPEGGVLIGLRAPTPGGRALLFALENPERVIEGQPPRIGAPILLELAGLGVRSLSYWHGRYLVAAGDWGEGKTSRLFSWDGSAEHAVPLPNDFTHFNPEGFFTPEDRDQFMVLSDDGTEASGGDKCKDREDPSDRRFRGRWVTLPDGANSSARPRE
jgi:hypothetical protein